MNGCRQVTKCPAAVRAQSLGHAGRQTKRPPKSQSRSCSKARRDFASQVGRRHRVQMVIEGGCHSTCITAYHVIEFPLTSGRRRPCRDGGGGEIAPGFAMLHRAERASHTDVAASIYLLSIAAPADTRARFLELGYYQAFQQYSGRAMRESHEQLKITEAEWAAFCKDGAVAISVGICLARSRLRRGYSIMRRGQSPDGMAFR